MEPSGLASSISPSLSASQFWSEYSAVEHHCSHVAREQFGVLGADRDAVGVSEMAGLLIAEHKAQHVQVARDVPGGGIGQQLQTRQLGALLHVGPLLSLGLRHLGRGGGAVEALGVEIPQWCGRRWQARQPRHRAGRNRRGRNAVPARYPPGRIPSGHPQQPDPGGRAVGLSVVQWHVRTVHGARCKVQGARVHGARCKGA